jgi:hypothetical protein
MQLSGFQINQERTSICIHSTAQPVKRQGQKGDNKEQTQEQMQIERKIGVEQGQEEQDGNEQQT